MIYLERGDLVIGSTPFTYFLWFRGFSCCLFDISCEIGI